MRKKKNLTSLLMLLTAVFAFAMMQCKFDTEPPQKDRAVAMDVSAEGGGEEGIITEHSLEEAFADDTFLVVLTKEASMTVQEGMVSFKEYTVEDFPELHLESVEDLSYELNELIIDQLAAEKTGDYSKIQEHFDLAMLMDIEEFRRILCLTLCEGERSKENILQAVSLLGGREDVLAAEPDFTGTFDAVPPGSNYSSKQKSYMDKIFMEEAWDIQTGSSAITVGVIDTGIQYNHTEYSGRINGGLSRDFTCPVGVDTPNPTDPYGHGTEVSSVIGMRGVNAIGVC